MKQKLTLLLLILLAPSLLVGDLSARMSPEAMKDSRYYFSSANAPAFGIVAHRIGNIVLAVNNNGTLGTGFSQSGNTDYFTDSDVPSCEYPKNSNTSYLYAAAFWIGAVVGRDTLVSVTADGWSSVREFLPEPDPFGRIQKRSITFPDVPEFEGAISEEDYIMSYNDTTVNGIQPDATDGRAHRPLNIEVYQNSYAWSYPYAEDFILFDYQIKNIGTETLEDVYMGYYNDADVGSTSKQSIYTDDICGFIESVPSTFGNCEFLDTVNIAWVADNDGDPTAQQFNNESVTSVTGMRIVRTPADTLDVSFNWWISGSGDGDFGPREKSGVGRRKEDFRDFNTGGLGTPEGDRNKYYQLSNKEFDYDQVFSAVIQPTDTLWLLPNQERAPDYADGFDTRYLLSFGPFDIDPGEVLPISFAFIGGENFHTDVNNLDNLPNNPTQFYKNLDFSDFGENSTWASWVYDNPGVDTDGDNYYGKTRVCCDDSGFVRVDTVVVGFDTTFLDIYVDGTCDTMYYEGDGVPDFRGASPPPAPTFWLDPSVGEMRIRFNGLRSETTEDIFSGLIDFEGYRVYFGLDQRSTSFQKVSSYDIEDYNKLVWNTAKRPFAGFDLLEPPFTLDSLQKLYGENFNPKQYTRSSPFSPPGYPDSTFYFVPQDFNASVFGINTEISKIYPDAPEPTTLVADSADAEELTDDGYFKYFEYEITIDNLLPSIPHWFNVTAFDFGSPESGLASLETAVSLGAQSAYPVKSYDEVESGIDDVYVFPNPYRIDQGYRASGYEGRTDSDRPDDRLRQVNFANLPPKCTIKIFTLDGDLVREIIHDKDISDPEATVDYWDLITRNTQLAVAGIYYYSIESDNAETQIGKIVLIM